MELFTPEIEKKLQDQYRFGAELDQQEVVAKIFNPYGSGVWYLLNQNPEDTDYLWVIVDMYEIEMGSVLKSELESIKIKPFNLPLERDMYFKPINAQKLWKELHEGKRYETGGTICEEPLGVRESAKLTEKLGVLEHSKQKNGKVEKWIQTGMIDGVEVKTITEGAKRLGMSVKDLLPLIPR